MRFRTFFIIAPVTEHFPTSQVSEALAHLESGKSRYCVVFANDMA